MVDLVDDIRGPAADDAAPGGWRRRPPRRWSPGLTRVAPTARRCCSSCREPIDSFEHRARDAARRRLALEPALLDALPPDASDRAAAALRDVHAPAAPVRASGYRRLGEPAPGAARAARVISARGSPDSATIEAHLSALANLEAEAREDRQRRDRVRAARDAVVARWQPTRAGCAAAATRRPCPPCSASD